MKPTHARTGAVNTALTIVGSSLAAVGLFTWLLIAPADPTNSGSGDPIVLYCAAGIQKPVAESAKAYAEERFGLPIELQYGGSGTLLSNLRVAKRGDLYLAADTSYMEIARKEGLLAEAVPLAKQRAVIAVKKGNPKEIQSIADLLKKGVKFAIANPDAASIGKLTKKLLQKTGEWEQIDKTENKKVEKPTVNEIITDILVGQVDAAIVWDANVKQQPGKLEAIHVPVFDKATKEITIGVLKWCKRPADALRFARYLQAPEKGQQAFKKFGYELIDGDDWAPTPKLTLFSGGVNRLAIEQTLEEFKQREGVELNVTYHGCGILVGQIKAGAKPDAYFTCDSSYMQQVLDEFGKPLTVSETDMVIIVKKDEKRIRSLADLTKDGLKVGVANPEQSALGGLTETMLKELNLFDLVKKNYAVQTPTADLLVNQLRTGSLDAAIVYRANVSQVQDTLKVISITQGNPLAEQAIAVFKNSKYKHLTQRLISAITTAKSRKRFESTNFRWRAGDATP